MSLVHVESMHKALINPCHRVGDIVDIKANGAVQKGSVHHHHLPYPLL